jgi:hypothetical protein
MSKLAEEVRHRLATLKLSDVEREEVIAEISYHLEVAAGDLAREERVDFDQVLAQVGDWQRLKKGIEQSKERGMKDRLRRIWLPALGTAFIAYAAQSIIAHLVAWPRVIHFSSSYLVYTWQWLFVLMITGALGAFCSRMMGGSVRDRLIVALAPSEVLGTFVLALLPIDLGVQWVIDRQVPYALTHPAVVVVMLTWIVLIPAVPSILGAAWFLREDEVVKPESRHLHAT